jgi:hypothetical protein
MVIATREKTKKALELALKRLQKGKTKIVPLGTKLSIAGVAKEAGVSNATIHNRYPEVAEAIRSLLKTGQIKNLQLKQEGLKGFSAKLSQARKEIEILKSDLQKSQSIIFRLTKEIELLKNR